MEESFVEVWLLLELDLSCLNDFQWLRIPTFNYVL